MVFRGSKIDLTVAVNVSSLLATLQVNRAKHVAMFEKACAAHRQAIVRFAEEQLRAARDGKTPKAFPHRTPVSYASQYDRAIGMLNMGDTGTVNLTAEDYARLVEDDWDWKDEWSATNSTYIGG